MLHQVFVRISGIKNSITHPLSKATTYQTSHKTQGQSVWCLKIIIAMLNKQKLLEVACDSLFHESALQYCFIVNVLYFHFFVSLGSSKVVKTRAALARMSTHEQYISPVLIHGTAITQSKNTLMLR